MTAVVVTGGSSGIGRATALHLAAYRYPVIATVRREEDAEALVAASGGAVAAVSMDVADALSVERAASEIVGLLGDRGLFGLINNAGIVVPGPLEHFPIEEFQRQLDVNLTGVLRVTQAFLPQLRRARGRIVNVSSISGVVAFPMLGAYNASKFGLEGMSDALRMELRGVVDVSLVLPGPVKSRIWERARVDGERIWNAMPPIAHEQYDALYEGMRREFDKSQRRAIPAEKVARVVRRALDARRPKSRYRLDPTGVVRWLPDRWRDALALKVLSSRSRTVRPAPPRPGDSRAPGA